MFDETWKWAGKYRTKDGLNIGCPFFEIPHNIAVLIGDVRYWFENQTLGVDEIAVRFHHRLVGQIHAFPNGNGRHSRLLASVVVVKYGRPRFAWGRANLSSAGTGKDAYMSALRALDENSKNVQPLLDFAR